MKKKITDKKDSTIVKYNLLTTTYASELLTLAVALQQCYEISTLGPTQVEVEQLN